MRLKISQKWPFLAYYLAKSCTLSLKTGSYGTFSEMISQMPWFTFKLDIANAFLVCLGRQNALKMPVLGHFYLFSRDLWHFSPLSTLKWMFIRSISLTFMIRTILKSSLAYLHPYYGLKWPFSSAVCHIFKFLANINFCLKGLNYGIKLL